MAGLAVLVGLAFSASPALAAEAADCLNLEGAALASFSTETKWTEEKKAEVAHEIAASCWQEVRDGERYVAEQDAEVRKAQEEEAAKEAALAAEKRDREREQRARERERAAEIRRMHREWRRKPTVTEATAREFAGRVMRSSDYPIYRIDCRGGRINRTHWTCKVAIFYHCLRGRIQVRGDGYKKGRPWFFARGGKLRQCQI
jgi:hypothetical protein